jgi:hypothetical protein
MYLSFRIPCFLRDEKSGGAQIVICQLNPVRICSTNSPSDSSTRFAPSSKEGARSGGLLRQKAPRSDRLGAVIARLALFSESKQSHRPSNFLSNKMTPVIEPRNDNNLLSLKFIEPKTPYPAAPALAAALVAASLAYHQAILHRL